MEFLCGVHCVRVYHDEGLDVLPTRTIPSVSDLQPICRVDNYLIVTSPLLLTCNAPEMSSSPSSVLLSTALGVVKPV